MLEAVQLYLMVRVSVIFTPLLSRLPLIEAQSSGSGSPHHS